MARNELLHESPWGWGGGGVQISQEVASFKVTENSNQQETPPSPLPPSPAIAWGMISEH